MQTTSGMTAHCRQAPEIAVWVGKYCTSTYLFLVKVSEILLLPFFFNMPLDIG